MRLPDVAASAAWAFPTSAASTGAAHTATRDGNCRELSRPEMGSDVVDKAVSLELVQRLARAFTNVGLSLIEVKMKA